MVEGKCPECGSEDLIYDYERAEVVCGRCGLVINEISPDGFYSSNECDNVQKYNKVVQDSITFSLHNKGLGTNIDNKNNDGQGEKIPSKNRQQLYKLRKWEWKTNISGSQERNLSKALNEIDNYASQLGFSKDMKEDSSLIYRNALDHGLIKGRGIDKTVAACIYITCRRFKVPITLDEIAEMTGFRKTRDVARAYRSLCRELDIKLPLTSPIDYIPRFASELGLSGEIQAKAIEIIKKSTEKRLAQGKPTVIAGAALYAVLNSTDSNITLEDISRVTCVGEVTIKKRAQELLY